MYAVALDNRQFGQQLNLLTEMYRLRRRVFKDRLGWASSYRRCSSEQPSRSPETMVRRDATLTMFFLGLREFQQMLDFCSSIDAQSPCAWARAMEAG
jgi:hypothetical protein